MRRKLRVAYSPDSDDAFNFYAWEYGKVSVDADVELDFHRAHIIELNHLAQRGEFDVIGISSAFFPRVASDYSILEVGNSVGRDFGPVLVSKDYESINDLAGKRIGVGGHPTTGSCLAVMFAPKFEIVPMRFDQIADAIVDGALDAGVMIHEELLFFPEKGLRLVEDLGKRWLAEIGLPLPVGLNVVRKSLGDDLARKIATTCQESLLWGFENSEETIEYASTFGRGMAREHLARFSNLDTLMMRDDVRRALPVLFARLAAAGLAPPVENFVIVESEIDRSRFENVQPAVELE